MRDGLLRELLAIEVELRARAARTATADDLRGLYPEWDQAIASVFASGRPAARQRRAGRLGLDAHLEHAARYGSRNRWLRRPGEATVAAERCQAPNEPDRR